MTQENPFARDLAGAHQATTARDMIALLKTALAEAERGTLLGLGLVTINQLPDGQAHTQVESRSTIPAPFLETAAEELKQQVHRLSFPNQMAAAQAQASALRKMSS